MLVLIDQDTIIRRVCERKSRFSPPDVHLMTHYTARTSLGTFYALWMVIQYPRHSYYRSGLSLMGSAVAPPSLALPCLLSPHIHQLLPACLYYPVSSSQVVLPRSFPLCLIPRMALAALWEEVVAVVCGEGAGIVAGTISQLTRLQYAATCFSRHTRVS